MGTYTNISNVREATGYNLQTAPSSTINFAINRGESVMKVYLGYSPATTNLSGSDFWVTDVATNLAAHYLSMRLATQFAPGVNYAQGMKQDGGAEWKGYSVMAQHWWNQAMEIMALHGRDVNIIRVDNS